MRLCRFEDEKQPRAAFYFDDRIVPIEPAARVYQERTHKKLPISGSDDLLEYLPPQGKGFRDANEIASWLADNPGAADGVQKDLSSIRLLTPIPRPPKLLLLAGNYVSHIEEGGGVAVTRQKTFPYVFMKPIATTLNHPGAPIPIPSISPNHIDWEVELGVVIGKRARGVTETEALRHVAGYTVVNDISDRKFRPNPMRQLREGDSFFDWLHGKWHDGFCPVGPCIRSADSLPDPQQLRLTLKVNGDLKQNSSTAEQIFFVAAVVAFISSFVTLEPGDIISTGTPAGTGVATNTFLKVGDRMEAAIEGIGMLRNQMVAG